MQACFMLARVRTPSWPVREREREIKREKEGERERGRKRERERKREYLFLKGMTGALVPFRYLVENVFRIIKHLRLYSHTLCFYNNVSCTNLDQLQIFALVKLYDND